MKVSREYNNSSEVDKGSFEMALQGWSVVAKRTNSKRLTCLDTCGCIWLLPFTLLSLILRPTTYTVVYDRPGESPGSPSLPEGTDIHYYTRI